MQIEILSTKVNTIPTAKGSYQQLELAYKNLTFQGKVEGKKLMSFGAGADAFKILANAQQGEVYDVQTNKNGQGFIDWLNPTRSNSVGGASVASQSTATHSGPIRSTSTGTGVSKSTYETPEERAKKQVYIVRQSSISSAVELLTTGAKSPPKVDDVLDVARKLEKFVFGDELDFIADPTNRVGKVEASEEESFEDVPL